VRALAILLAAAAIALAEDEAELAGRVQELVRGLGSPSAEAREMARERLATYGERIVPLLKSVTTDDPEVRRSLLLLTRAAGVLRFELQPLPDALPIGAPLVLRVQVVNNTEQTHALVPPAARKGEFGPFRVRIGDQTAAVRLDDTTWDAGGEAGPVILPGAATEVTLRLAGVRSPLRRPALYAISVIYDGTASRGYGDVADDGEDGFEHFRLVAESRAIEVHVLGRRPEELERALEAKDANARAAAARELSLRDDEAILPILRRHAGDRALRLAAVTRLGPLADPRDLELFLEAARDGDSGVRRAAVHALGLQKDARARRRLIGLAQDHELQAYAIKALRSHRHVATIDQFVHLLRLRACPRDCVDEMRAALHEWTGLDVEDRPSEIARFEAWWVKNRATWARESTDK
jgi:hypothetical protein